MENVSYITSTNSSLNGDNIFTIINCSIYFLCAFFLIILNLLLIISWYFNRTKNNYSDFIIISLAVADFTNGLLVCNGYFVITLLGQNNVNKFFIFMVYLVDFSVYLISFLSLIILSYHRLRQLLKPFEEKAKINRFRTFLIISIWIVCFVFGFLKNYTRKYLINSLYYINLISISTNIIAFYIPILWILVLNILLVQKFIAKLKEKKIKIKNNQTKNEKNAIACVICINFGLILSMGLWLVLYPFELYKFEFALSFHEIDLAIAYFYSIIDPFVVFLFSKKYRKIFFKSNQS